MKFVFGIAALALIAIVSADVSHLGRPSNDYLPPFQGGQQQHGGPSVNRDYLPPFRSGEAPAAHSFGADGYRYKSPHNNLRF